MNTSDTPQSYVEIIPGVKILQMGIGKAPSIGAANTDVTLVKKDILHSKCTTRQMSIGLWPIMYLYQSDLLCFE